MKAGCGFGILASLRWQVHPGRIPMRSAGCFAAFENCRTPAAQEGGCPDAAHSV